jgi:hypothetical protein
MRHMIRSLDRDGVVLPAPHSGLSQGYKSYQSLLTSWKLCETFVSMAFDSGSTLDNDKAQLEALVQEVDEPERKISTFSLISKPAVLILIPVALTILSVYLGFSWTEFLDTGDWIYNNGQVFGDWVCYSNGSADYELDWDNSDLKQSVWDTSQFLDITLGFGS